jgi:hypothetical protein
MGTTMNDHESIYYVLSSEPSDKTLRINMFDPSNGNHLKTYFMSGANLLSGTDAFSYHIEYYYIDSFQDFLFLTALSDQLTNPLILYGFLLYDMSIQGEILNKVLFDPSQPSAW